MDANRWEVHESGAQKYHTTVNVNQFNLIKCDDMLTLVGTLGGSLSGANSGEWSSRMQPCGTGVVTIARGVATFLLRTCTPDKYSDPIA
eukprot:312969-Amphidinium_carterae.1